MSECPHKQLKKQLVGEQVWYVCECGQKFKVEPWDGRVEVLAESKGLALERIGALPVTKVGGGFGTWDDVVPQEYLRKSDVLSALREKARAGARTCYCGTPTEPHSESVHEQAWRASQPPAVEREREQEAQFNEHAQNCPKCWATLRHGSRDIVCDKGAAILAKEICEAEAGAQPESYEYDPRVEGVSSVISNRANYSRENDQ